MNIHVLVLHILVPPRYKIGKDPAGWLNVNQDTGMIKVKSSMDRESALVKDGKYRAVILALDDGNFFLQEGVSFYSKRRVIASIAFLNKFVLKYR